MRFRRTTPYYLSFFLLLLSPYGLALSLKKRNHADNVATLREAVSNAFDALTEVQQAIPKYDGDVFEEESIDYGDVSMDKETAEKFVEEIDELEDILLNKDSSEKRKREETSDKNTLLAEKMKKSIEVKELPTKRRKDFNINDFLEKRGKNYDVKDFFEKEKAKEMRAAQKDEKKGIDTSIDVLLDVLKKGLDDGSHDTKFEEYLLSNFAKETSATADASKDLKSITGSTKETSNVASDSSNVKKSNVSQAKKETEMCGGSKKECPSKDAAHAVEKKVDKKETKDDEKKDRSNSKDVKSNPLKKKTASPNAKPAIHHTPKKHKRPMWSKKESLSDVQYDREIKDLVSVILKRREETKREKLKLALADLFDILDSKRAGSAHK